ncbi:DapH/DapD/GlmU-related protein [Aliarcobacter butzleri]|uniref:DapH/DapD/GlmU-related protein n=1 Tax=Aliarcobacter butzleri TaxID=28197 RepID=UPI00125F9BA2|nr:DapH/DapD/GlmU-related protein [Aliarcobacter butzleri]
MFRGYSLYSFITLIKDLFLTKMLYPKCRIIRFPFYTRNEKQIMFGKNFTAGRGNRIDAFSFKTNEKVIVFGDNCQINDYCHIAAAENIKFGNNVLVASKVYITDHDHGDTSLESLKSIPINRPILSKSVSIEDNVWIGEGAMILKGVTIGKNSIVAASAVVTKNVPPFSVVAGIPAKIIRTLENE